MKLAEEKLHIKVGNEIAGNLMWDLAASHAHQHADGLWYFYAGIDVFTEPHSLLSTITDCNNLFELRYSFECQTVCELVSDINTWIVRLKVADKRYGRKSNFTCLESAIKTLMLL